MIIKYQGHEYTIPDSKKATGKICFIGDLTHTNTDLNEKIHKGFTIGKGKTLYWMMVCNSNGNFTVYSSEGSGQPKRRWLSGNTEITVHFK